MQEICYYGKNIENQKLSNVQKIISLLQRIKQFNNKWSIE